MRLSNILLLFYCLVFITSCKTERRSSIEQKQPTASTQKEVHLLDKILEKYSVRQNTNQVILSYNQNISETTGQLIGFEKIDGQWQPTFDTIVVNFGKNGFASLDKKLEGDGKSPTGVFEIGKAFGYSDNISHHVDFITLHENHYWDSDSNSPTYNQLLSEKPTTPFIEIMRRKDHLYKYGIIIEYNTKEVISEKGSAIFLHIQRKKGAYTAGCISMNEKDIIHLIKWLKPNQQPMIAMGNWSELIE